MSFSHPVIVVSLSIVVCASFGLALAKVARVMSDDD
jgi:hypothetical protein